VSDLIPVEIQRSKWLRGRPGEGCLRNADGLQCCLGFVAVEAGYSETLINYNDIGSLCDGEGVNGPPRLFRELVQVSKTVDPEDDYESTDVGGTPLEQSLIEINDDGDLNDDEREAKLIEVAAKAGIQFVFVD
jgi:hypothetical protein